MWKSENDFSEKVGGADRATEDLAIAIGLGCGIDYLTRLTSPAINLSLASTYCFPLQLSIVTQPPTSAFFSN